MPKLAGTDPPVAQTVTEDSEIIVAKVGVQAMMLKESVAEIGTFETLRKLSDIGYHAVEISQIPMSPATVADLDRARTELGMDIGALSVTVASPVGAPNDCLDRDFDKIIADAKRLDVNLLRIGMLPLAGLRSKDAVIDFARQANKYALQLADHGIRLYYHNHHIDFVKFDGTYLLDIIGELSPAVGFELDVHWVQRGGLDPVRTIDHYAGRTAMIHLKDYRIAQPPPEAFALLDAGDSVTFRDHVRNSVQFAEVGEGNLDFPAIIEHSLAAGAEYLLVEQDDLYGRTVWESLQISYDNLIKLGAGDLF